MLAGFGTKRAKRGLAAGLVLAGMQVGLPGAVSAQSLGKHQEHTQASLGVRTSLVSDAGYDPYAEDNVLTQGSVGLSRTLFAEGEWSMAAAAGFDFGGVSATVRGEHSELDLYRFGLAPEARFHLLPRLYFLGRLGPTLSRDRVKVYDSAAATDLSSAGWTFGFDSALGAAYEVIGKTSGANHGTRGWVQLEFGYGWSASRDITLEPRGDDADAAPERVNGVSMPALAIRGPAVKVAVAASF
ncbi:MAG: hypothetical protein KC766_34925 [Myxococcales bacterium]|nr:hypothetical protein [Myxococcales bacterium]